jgi:aminoglycoside 2'-N-acetyltransferase I
MATEIRGGSDDLQLRLARTAELDVTELRHARELLELSFEGDFSDQDWEHALGGVHVLASRGGMLVGHGSLVERRLLYAGLELRAGYVEALAVHPDQRRRGIAQRIMDVLEGEIARAFELGALSASDAAAALYRQRGWLPWTGSLSAMSLQGITPTPEEQGGVFVLSVGRQLDLGEALTIDYRDGDVW